MQLRSRQTGLGALGWLIVLAVASFGLICFFRVGPLYLDYYQTKQVLDDVFAGDAAAGKSRQELTNTLVKRLDVNRIETIKANDIQFTETREGREVDASYEKRVALIANIDVVVKFDKLKYRLPQ